ncbi:hypothetical protein Athai_42820 [Actinocatenispora thailandica]|uniref:Uncharacterized protein n=1 Tax=Actinocatenispora thailandica TaxID=227318 RepID=A0A7R7DS20_9ACTN|nr:hypothetical protein [Actinocatenispora thailandica]BCJ36779.1 hypothetical protein Athai_42820 [Actinocatenispora thailandica]
MAWLILAIGIAALPVTGGLLLAAYRENRAAGPRRPRRSGHRPRTLVLLGIAALFGAGICYGVGVTRGQYLLDPDQMCSLSPGRWLPHDADPPRELTIERRYAPVSVVCAWPDGRRTELVPAWVNPAAGLLAATGVGAIAAAITWTLRRPRTVPRPLAPIEE